MIFIKIKNLYLKVMICGDARDKVTHKFFPLLWYIFNYFMVYKYTQINLYIKQKNVT